VLTSRTTRPPVRKTRKSMARRAKRARRRAHTTVATSGKSHDGGPTGSDAPSSGGSQTLAMTGSASFRVTGLGLGLLAIGEASRQTLRRRRRPKEGLRA
jgi:hypothetical protein